jgi:hypothetical protein|tara:strand:- start:33427 stop:33678 length:252 start_codon:yes stop_codon:yes gene_type:complete
MLEEIIEQYQDEELLIADGFDEAVIGIATDFTEPRLIYSVKKCIEILMSDGTTSYEDALEYFTFNTSGAWVGEQTPIWCWDEI